MITLQTLLLCMKRILFQMVLIALLPLSAFGRYFDYDYKGYSIRYTVVDEDAKTCKTKRYYPKNEITGNNVAVDLILPMHPKDGEVEYTLTEIGGHSFRDREDINSVMIPNSVTEIGECAFEVTMNVVATAVDEIESDFLENSIDFNSQYEIYNMNGCKVADSKVGLSKGFYIIRQGNTVVKTMIK